MAKNAMFYLVILSVILALAFATNKKDAKEAENHSAGIFGKVGRFVTVALAVSSRLGGAGASQGDGAVHGGEKAVANIRSNQLPNNNWMAPPPPMPMKSAEVGRFVTVALAMSSRLGGAGASREVGAVHGVNLKYNELPNKNWMAPPPPPMPMKSAEFNRSVYRREGPTLTITEK
uniref:CLAVATA3/ESR-like protein n=1 Tax=Globodera pallida TaxID=36090 RepID=A0A183CDF1_GLOPA